MLHVPQHSFLRKSTVSCHPYNETTFCDGERWNFLVDKFFFAYLCFVFQPEDAPHDSHFCQAPTKQREHTKKLTEQGFFSTVPYDVTEKLSSFLCPTMPVYLDTDDERAQAFEACSAMWEAFIVPKM